MFLLMTLIDFKLNITMDILTFWMTCLLADTLTLMLTGLMTLTSTSLRRTTGVQRQGAYGWPAFFSTLFYSRDFPAESA